MSDVFDATDPIPAQHCPHNEPHHHWLIRYYGPRSGPVELLYTGPDEGDAVREIARLEMEGNHIECARLTGASAAGESPAGRRRQATTSTPSHGPSFARMEVKR